MSPFLRLQPTESTLWAVLFSTLVMMSAAGSLAQEGSFSETSPIFLKWSAGFDFSRGDYGLNESTTLYYVPLSVTLDYRRFRARVGIPFLASSGPTQLSLDTSRGGGSSVEIIDSDKSQGVGQLQVDLSYLFDPLVEGLPYLELSSKISAPTESRRDLGSGLWSVAAKAEVFESIGRFTPYLSSGRKFYERCGCEDSLRDRFFASVGATVVWTKKLSVGVGYDWLEAARKGNPDSHEIVPYASYRLNDDWSVGPYTVIGLSNGSPDFGVGFSVSVRQ